MEGRVTRSRAVGLRRRVGDENGAFPRFSADVSRLATVRRTADRLAFIGPRWCFFALL